MSSPELLKLYRKILLLVNPTARIVEVTPGSLYRKILLLVNL